MKVHVNGQVTCEYDIYNVPAAKDSVAQGVRRMITELQKPVAGRAPIRYVTMDLPRHGSIRVTIERVS